MSSDEWLFDLMKQYWMDPCTAVVRPYSPAELQAHNLCAAVPPMIFMFALVGFVSLMAYLQSRGEQQKLKREYDKEQAARYQPPGDEDWDDDDDWAMDGDSWGPVG